MHKWSECRDETQNPKSETVTAPKNQHYLFLSYTKHPLKCTHLIDNAGLRYNDGFGYMRPIIQKPRRERRSAGPGLNESMASILARRSLRMHVVRLASHLPICSRPELNLLAPPSVTSLSSHRRVLQPSPSSAPRRELSVVRVRRGGMDGEGETARAGASDPKMEEQVVVDSKKIEKEEKLDSEAEKESDDKKEEEVESRVGEWFRLKDSCSLVLHRGDITNWYKDGKTDAIVNAANERMLGGGGVDGAIHRAAGKGLLDACFKVPEVSRGVRCPVGSAVITPGFNLPVNQVIHTVGPMYYSEGDPASVLAKAYKNSVSLAVKNRVKYIAFPAISCGVYGYPYDEAAEVSIQALQDSAGQLSEVHFVLFEAGTYNAWLAEAEEKLERLST